MRSRIGPTPTICGRSANAATARPSERQDGVAAGRRSGPRADPVARARRCPSPSSSTTSPGARKRPDSTPAPPGTVPEPSTSPGCSVHACDAYAMSAPQPWCICELRARVRSSPLTRRTSSRSVPSTSSAVTRQGPSTLAPSQSLALPGPMPSGSSRAWVSRADRSFHSVQPKTCSSASAGGDVAARPADDAGQLQLVVELLGVGRPGDLGAVADHGVRQALVVGRHLVPEVGQVRPAAERLHRRLGVALEGQEVAQRARAQRAPAAARAPPPRFAWRASSSAGSPASMKATMSPSKSDAQHVVAAQHADVRRAAGGPRRSRGARLTLLPPAPQAGVGDRDVGALAVVRAWPLVARRRHGARPARAARKPPGPRPPTPHGAAASRAAAAAARPDPPARRSGRARGGPAGAPRWRPASAARPRRRRRPAASAAPGSGARRAPRRRRRRRRPCRRPWRTRPRACACPGAGEGLDLAAPAAAARPRRSCARWPRAPAACRPTGARSGRRRPAATPATSRVGSITWRAPRARAPTPAGSGSPRTSAPAAPPWSRCTCVSSRWRRSPTSTPCAARPALQRRQVRARAAVDERRLAVGQQVGGVQPARPYRLAAEVERQHADPPPAAARTAPTMRP